MSASASAGQSFLQQAQISPHIGFGFGPPQHIGRMQKRQGRNAQPVRLIALPLAAQFGDTGLRIKQRLVGNIADQQQNIRLGQAQYGAQ